MRIVEPQLDGGGVERFSFLQRSPFAKGPIHVLTPGSYFLNSQEFVQAFDTVKGRLMLINGPAPTRGQVIALAAGDYVHQCEVLYVYPLSGSGWPCVLSYPSNASEAWIGQYQGVPPYVKDPRSAAQKAADEATRLSRPIGGLYGVQFGWQPNTSPPVYLPSSANYVGPASSLIEA
jgi:hypothetical protein